jgi:peptidoglycan hydrolase FlgJ
MPTINKSTSTPLGANLPPKVQQKMRATAREYETLFLEQMFQHVFPQPTENGPLGGTGLGGSEYRSMLVKEYASTVAKAGGIGLSEPLYREFVRMQESKQ